MFIPLILYRRNISYKNISIKEDLMKTLILDGEVHVLRDFKMYIHKTLRFSGNLVMEAFFFVPACKYQGSTAI